jgi:hypothetical protein
MTLIMDFLSAGRRRCAGPAGYGRIQRAGACGVDAGAHAIAAAIAEAFAAAYSSRRARMR